MLYLGSFFLELMSPKPLTEIKEAVYYFLYLPIICIVVCSITILLFQKRTFLTKRVVFLTLICDLIIAAISYNLFLKKLSSGL